MSRGSHLGNGRHLIDETDMKNGEEQPADSQRKLSISQDASNLVGNCESVLKKGFLDKCKLSSSNTNKKWKRFYFVLNAREQVLYSFEDKASVRENLVIVGFLFCVLWFLGFSRGRERKTR